MIGDAMLSKYALQRPEQEVSEQLRKEVADGDAFAFSIREKSLMNVIPLSLIFVIIALLFFIVCSVQ